MPQIATRRLFHHCYGRYGIAAVNVFTMEQIHGLLAASEKFMAPVIVQVTPAARSYAHPLMLRSMIEAAGKIYPGALYAVHLDHGEETHIRAAISEGGYNSVMIDASHDEFFQNVQRTRTMVGLAHENGLSVEAELGVLAGVEDDMSIEASASRYTNPAQAKEFVERTGCDSLAVAVGTSHGAYKFSGGKGLQFEVLEKIQQALPGFPLVLHGSSQVSGAEVEAINAFGGKIAGNASGVSDHELQKALLYGICKVNIATDFRLLWTKVHRQFFYEKPEAFDPVIPGREYMRQFLEIMAQRLEVLRSTGKSQELIKISQS